MGRHLCETCGGLGRVAEPNRGWRFWRTIQCHGCNGDGYMRPKRSVEPPSANAPRSHEATVDEVKRVHGWPVGVPIKMVGGGEAFVVGEQMSSDYPISGYRVDFSGNVCGMSWSIDGRNLSRASPCDLDPSFLKIPEPELPLWTIDDSEALLGKVLRQKGLRKVWLVTEVDNDGLLRSAAIGRPYCFVAENYTHLDGTEIPKRRMP